MYILNKLKIFSSIFILITIISFLLLSQWQYNKYKYKMYSNIFNYNLKNQNPKLFSENLYKNKIKLFINCNYQNNFLVENQIYKKKYGYNLYTSCKLENSNSIIFISRGWLYKNFLNKIKNLPLIFNLSGLSYKPVIPLKINKYSNEIKNSKSIILFQRITNLIIDKCLYNKEYFYIKLEKDNKYMYNVIIKNSVQIKPIRHFFYSLQWVFFAITLFILYTKFIFKKKI